MPVTSLLLLLLVPQPSSACATVEVCRAEALIAHARQDYEAFHDLAWATYRKGRQNDPELMLLVARAQSLSGRPGDALVMLERVAARGPVPDEVITDDDFARMRALPRWNEVRETLSTAPLPAATRPVTPATPPATEKSAEARGELPAPSKPVPAKVDSSKPTAPKSEPPSSERPKPEPADPEAPKPEPPKTTREPGAPLKFTTLLAPTALAYDAVSKRYLIADRRARRIAAIDANSGQVATLVGALGALGDISGIAIDPQQGDLWVVSSASDGDSIHRTQLISGRVLSTTRLTVITAPIVALTFVRGAGLVAADASGIVWRIGANGRAERLIVLEYVPRALAADAAGRLYVSAGGPRLARFTLLPALRRLDPVDLDGQVAPDGPFAIADGRLVGVVASDEGYEIRSVALKAAGR